MSPSESHITGQSGTSCSQESLNQFKTDWERAIRGGPQPVIAAYMDKVSESERVVVQKELKKIDQEYRHRLAKSTHAEIDLTPEIVSPTTEEKTTKLNLSANEHEDAGTLSTAAFISEEKAEKGNLHEKRSTPASPGSIAKTLGALEEYELLDELGRGGMGVVYKARERSVNRVVALKMMLAGQFASPEALRRFQIEAESVASLDHPNIIPIYHVGEINGMPYFVMKYVDGTSLDRFARGRFTTEPQAAAELLRKICLAVHFAHQRGILHRDLKPGNILIDQHGEPHITDFGLAKRMDQDQGETQTGTVIGTPDYMSPEQAAGLSNNVSVASDVYSLGSVLFDLLTGEPPFRSKTMMQTLMRVTKEPVRSPTSLNRSIGLDLETICLKCLDKDSERRYSSAGEVAAELERYLKGHPIHGRRVGKLERTQRWCRRNPKVAMLGAFAFVLLTFLAIAGPIAALQFAHQADRYRRLAYVTAMRVAHQECIEGEVENAIELLEEHIPQPNQQDLRGFEWYHLWRLCQRNLTAQAIKIETGGKVRDILFCEEGQAVISASSFERSSSSFVEIRKWSASKPSSNATDVLASCRLDGIGFQKLSPDGKVLAVGHNDGQITLLNISTGATASLDGLTSAVFCLAFFF